MSGWEEQGGRGALDCAALERWLDAERPAIHAATMEVHAASCSACARRLRADDAVGALFAAAAAAATDAATAPGGVVPPPRFVDRVLARIADEPQVAPAPASFGGLWVRLSDPLPWWVRATARPATVLALVTLAATVTWWRALSGAGEPLAGAAAALVGAMVLLVSGLVGGFEQVPAAAARTAVLLALLPAVALASYALYRAGERFSLLALPSGLRRPRSQSRT